MSKPKAPSPPSPQATSAAQTGTSVATAIANARLNNVNQVTPDGNLTYAETGQDELYDPFTGQTYTIPRTTVTQTLSPQQQAIADQNNAAELGLSKIANKQTAFLDDYLSKPFDGSNEATEARLMELGRKRLDPMLSERKAALETRLSNQGIKIGSEAYTRAMRDNLQGDNDAFNQLLLTGRGQAFSEGQAIRNQPINEISSLMSGSQVNQPNFGSYNQGQIATTDNAGLINNNYNQQFQGYQQKLGNWNNTVGGLFGLGAGLIGA